MYVDTDMKVTSFYSSKLIVFIQDSTTVKDLCLFIYLGILKSFRFPNKAVTGDEY